jgi:hypothetical protein
MVAKLASSDKSLQLARQVVRVTLELFSSSVDFLFRIRHAGKNSFLRIIDGRQ